MEVTSSGSPSNDNDICHNLLTLSSPTSSEGYFDSPVGSTVGDDISKIRSDEKRSNSTADGIVSDESVESSQSENEYWHTRQLIVTRLFPGANEENHADHTAPEIPTAGVAISPFTRELITRSRQEMERRRQKRLLNAFQTSNTRPSISDLIILEETPSTSIQQDAADLPTQPLSPENPFDNLALVAEYFPEGVVSVDESSRVINGSDDEQSNTKSTVVSDNFVVNTNGAEESHDLESAATAAVFVMELDHVEPETALPDVGDTVVDLPASCPDRSHGNDGQDEHADAQETTTKYDLVDESTNSELAAAAIEIEGNEDAMSTLPDLTETVADRSLSWEDRSQGSASDEEQMETKDTMTNYDVVVSNVDDDPSCTSGPYEFVGDTKDDESGTSTSNPSQRDMRKNQDNLDVNKYSSTTSLDFDAVFGPTRKRSAVSRQESSPQSMPSSLSLSKLVFGDQRDPCCSGRRGWLLFLAFVVLLVIIVAALVGRQSTTPTSSVVLTTIPSSAPSTAPSFSPSTWSPTTSPTTVPSAPTTPAPMFPPFAFTLTFPPYGWSSMTETPVNMLAPPTAASPVIIALAPMRLASQAPAATPTTISGGSGASSQQFPPFPLSILTYPPFTEVRPSGRNLRSRLLTTAAKSESNEGDLVQQQG